MLVCVCVKYVPDTEAISRINAPGSFKIPKADVLSLYDGYALALALNLGCEICVVSAGSESDRDNCVTYLRKSLAMGVSEAVYVSGLEPLSSSQNSAIALAGGLECLAEKYGKKPDIIMCGSRSIDLSCAEVPYRLAALLNMPIITEISSLDVHAGSVRAERQYDNMDEVIETGLPCLLTCTRNEFQLPYPTLKNLLAAKKKEIQTVITTEKDTYYPSPHLLSIQKSAQLRSCQIIEGKNAEEKAIKLLEKLNKKGFNLG